MKQLKQFIFRKQFIEYQYCLLSSSFLLCFSLFINKDDSLEANIQINIIAFLILIFWYTLASLKHGSFFKLIKTLYNISLELKIQIFFRSLFLIINQIFFIINFIKYTYLLLKLFIQEFQSFIRTNMIDQLLFFSPNFQETYNSFKIAYKDLSSVNVSERQKLMLRLFLYGSGLVIIIIGLYFDTSYTLLVPIILISIEIISKYCFFQLEQLVLPDSDLTRNDLNYFTYCCTLPVLFFCLTYEIMEYLETIHQFNKLDISDNIYYLYLFVMAMFTIKLNLITPEKEKKVGEGEGDQNENVQSLQKNYSPKQIVKQLQENAKISSALILIQIFLLFNSYVNATKFYYLIVFFAILVISQFLFFIITIDFSIVNYSLSLNYKQSVNENYLKLEEDKQIP